MPDFNDVVRHVILRILVDQSGLAEDIAKARSKLKALEDAEKEADKNRVQSAESVAKAYERQREAIDENRRAVEEHQQAVTKDADKASDRLNESTKQVGANTKAQTDAIKSVQAAEDKQHQRNLDWYKSEQKAAQDLEKVRIDAADRASREQQKLNQSLAAKQHDINDTEFIRDATQPQRLQGLLDEIAHASEQLKAQTEGAQHDARHRGSLADTAASDAAVARTAALAAEDRRSGDAVDRRARTLQTERRSRQELANLAAQGNILEQRGLEIADRRARSETNLAKAAQERQKGLGAFFESLGKVATGTAVVGGRSVFTAPAAARQAGRDVEQQFQQRRGVQDFGQSSFKDLEREATLGEKIVGNFFLAMGRDAEDGVLRVRKLRAEFTAFFADLNRNRGGSGAGLFKNIASSAVDAAQALNFGFGNLAGHFASMETVIVAVVAALGPLAAILGAVGAAGLGLASNMVALTGVLAALPGILTAIIGGFGALAIALGPVVSLIQSYSSAMKQTATSATQAKDAALSYRQAVLQQQQALIQLHRTQAEGILLQRRVDDARKEAKRNIEDYQEALKKLAFDEEGAQLDVNQALQNYKRTLADPTASSLDRQQAAHDYQGALQDQYDTQKQGKRTQQDARTAISRGVEGSDQVISAEQAMQDHAIALQTAQINWEKSVLATQKALLVDKAHGNTALADYEAQLKRMSPAAQKVVTAITDIIKPGGAWEKLRNALAEKIFGPVSQDTGKFKDVLDILAKFLSPVATAIGEIADQALRWLTSPEWKAFFERQGASSASLLTQMAAAAFSIADGIKNIVDAAGPFTQWLVGAVGAVAKEFDDWTKTTSGKNAIVGFLDNTERRIKEIWPIIKDFAAGFAGFFEALNAPSKAGAGDDFTSKINKGLGGMAKTFRDLGEEAAKPNSGFRKWLAEVGPLIKNIVHLLGQAAGFFGGLFSDKRNINEAKDILKEIGDKWLPKLQDIFGQLASSGAISKLGTYIGDIFDAVDKFLTAGGLDALKIVLDDVVQAGSVLTDLVSAFTSLPGVLKVVAEAIGIAFGVALFTRLSGIYNLIKGVLGVYRLFAGIAKDVRTPKADTSTEPSPGGSGTKKPGIRDRVRNRLSSGNSSLLNTEDPGAANPNTKKPGRNTAQRNSTEPQTGTRDLGNGQVRPTNSGTQTPSAKKPSRARQFVNTANENLKDNLSGASSTTAVLSRIEAHARQIAINTSGWGGASGGTTEPRPGGGTGGTGGGTRPRPTEPRPSGGAASRPSYTGRATAVPTRDSVRDQIDPYGNATRDQRTTGRGRTYEYSTGQSDINRQRQEVGLGLLPPTVGYKPGPLDEANARRQTTTTAYSPERQAENQRRIKAKLKPLPPDIVSAPASPAARNRDVGAADPNGYTVPVEPGGATDKENRYRAVENARRTRLGQPPLRPDEPTPRPTPTATNNLSYNQQRRLDAVVANRQARESGTGGVIPFTDEAAVTARQDRDKQRRLSEVTARRDARLSTGEGIVPRYDVEPEPAPRPKGQNPRERRQQAAAQRNAQQAAFGESLTDRHAGTPIADVGRDLTPYGVDTDEEFHTHGQPVHTVPTAEEVAGTRAPVTRDERGRIVSPYNEATRNLPAPEPAFARQKPTRTRQSRTATGQFGPAVPVEPEVRENRDQRRATVEAGLADQSERQSQARPNNQKTRRQRLLDALGAGSDEGSVGLGIGTRDTDEDDGTASRRRSRTTATRGGRVGRFFSRKPKPGAGGALGGLLGGLEGAAGGDGDFDEGYDEGYQDALGGGQGGSGSGRGKKSRRGATTEGGEDESVGSRRGRRGRNFGAVESLTEDAEQDFGRGGKRGLFGRLGGGLGRGLGAGLAGAAITGGLEMGGDALVDKFVKNDKDKGSLTRAVGAVSNGASIGSTIGGFLGPEGALIGGALGGVAGGIYSLFKDKNLRDFVEKKLANIGHIIADGFKGAIDGIRHFFSFLKDGWKQAFGIIGHFFADVGKSIGRFFAGLGKWALDAGKKVLLAFAEFLKFWYVTLPLTVLKFLFVTLPGYALKGAEFLLKAFLGFLKFWYVDIPLAVLGFFTRTLPGLAKKGWDFLVLHLAVPLSNFILKDVPGFFTRTIPHWFESVGSWFGKHVITPITDFFTKTIPDFFTKTIPDKIRGFGQTIKDQLVVPFQQFFALMKQHNFGYWLTHPGDFFSSLKSAFTDKKMSGGLIKGVYQGVEDKALTWTTPGEMVIRRSKVEEPGAKMFLQEFNERGMEALYSGLAASTKPPVMTMVAPDAQGLTGRVPTIVNNTVNHAPVMGDVTINNPVREKAEHSLRRQVQLAAIRHRR